MHIVRIEGMPTASSAEVTDEQLIEALLPEYRGAGPGDGQVKPFVERAEELPHKDGMDFGSPSVPSARAADGWRGRAGRPTV